MEPNNFYTELPKIELHAHLNGSLSQSTMLELKRYHADRGLVDKTNAFFDEFKVGAGDTRNLTDCFQVFNIAHSLTSTPETLSLATKLTIQEFQDDGCCYIELRSTPRLTEYMNKKEYMNAIVNAILESSESTTIISKFVVSINRALPLKDAEEITQLAIEYNKLHPNVVVGVEVSGNPMVGRFETLLPLLQKVRQESELKITLHCGEVCNQREVLEMLKFQPDRIGHGIFIHPKYGGTEDTWNLLCELKIPVEICLTSNVNTKLTPDYDSHHFKEFYNADIPVIICTDDKGVFSTSLSQEYRLCAETFNLTQSSMAQLALTACQHVFSKTDVDVLKGKVKNFIESLAL